MDDVTSERSNSLTRKGLSNHACGQTYKTSKSTKEIHTSPGNVSRSQKPEEQKIIYKPLKTKVGGNYFKNQLESF